MYTKIHYFYRNNDFNGDLTCVRGMKAPAAPAVPLMLVAVLPINKCNITIFKLVSLDERRG